MPDEVACPSTSPIHPLLFLVEDLGTNEDLGTKQAEDPRHMGYTYLEGRMSRAIPFNAVSRVIFDSGSR